MRLGGLAAVLQLFDHFARGVGKGSVGVHQIAQRTMDGSGVYG